MRYPEWLTKPRLSAALALILLTWAGQALSDPQADKPSAQFLAAALSLQETMTGPCLEVSYSQTVGMYDGATRISETVKQYRYVRQADAQRLDMTFGDIMESTFYDRQSCKSDAIVTGPLKQAQKGHNGPGLLSIRDSYETSLKWVGTGTLSERLAQGSVLDNKESIDGHSCWLVILPADRPGIKHFKVWLDDSVGFNPRKIAYIWTAREPSTITYADYVKVGDGWLPKKQLMYYRGPSEAVKVRSTNQVSDIKIGPARPKAELQIAIPAGTRVAGPTGVVYISP